jgi:transposase-like protein
MPKKIDSEARARGARLVADHLAEYPSRTAASAAVGKQVGVGRETVRPWVLQAQIDNGTRGGVTSEELAIKICESATPTRNPGVAVSHHRNWPSRKPTP